MFKCIESNEPFQEAGRVLSHHLRAREGNEILFLSSGGSAFEVLDFVDDSVLGEHITFSVLDERFTEPLLDRNFEQLKATSFWNAALKAGASALDVSPHKGESCSEAALRFEKSLMTWKKDHPQGSVVITQGIGEDGHTAGIFSLSDKEEFQQLFEKDRWVVGYSLDKKEEQQHQERITTTLTFLREEVSVSISIATGEKKRNVLDELFEQDCALHQFPARALYDTNEVILISDVMPRNAPCYDTTVGSHLEILKTFGTTSLPDLDVVVRGALELFEKVKPPRIDTRVYKRPLVVGSGNAEATGRIMFRNRDVVFASESTFEEKLRSIKDIDGVVLISASGGKHAPRIAKYSKEFGRPVMLVTTTEASDASRQLNYDQSDKDKEYIFPKNREPYTYNTSTYMGMILGSTGENPRDIQAFIAEKIDTLSLPDFSKYDKFYFIVPDEFAEIRRMLQVKFIELFGRKIARDVETREYVKHATTVIPSDELFISFGEENIMWGEKKNRLTIPLPDWADYGAMMAISYYTIGQIQKAHPPYFKDNIEAYVKEASKTFGHEIQAIVE